MGLFAWWRKRRYERRRQIFRFWDGERMRGIDPLIVIRGLSDHKNFDAATDPVLAHVQDFKVAGPAAAVCAQAVSDVFGVPAYDDRTGKGLLTGERLALLADFGRYVTALKKNGETTQTSSPATEAASTPSDSPTSSMWDSGSTSGDRKPDAPAASCEPSREL